MSQHDYDIANQLSASLRTDLNSALKALNSNNSGATEPADTFANMLWYDTTNNILKMKPEDNAAGQWISIGYLDQGTDTFKILDDTVVTTADGGTDAGLLGDQTTATWQAGTGTTESLVSPAKVKASVIANAPSSSLTLGTFTAASGNTFLDFTVPTTATEIYVNYYDVIPSGGVEVLMKVGGSPVTSGYYSSSGTSGAESGTIDSFYVYALSGRNLTGVMSITKAASNVWMETHSSTQNFAENSGAGRFINAGSVNGIRFQAGTSFSGGQVSVSYR